MRACFRPAKALSVISGRRGGKQVMRFKRSGGVLSGDQALRAAFAPELSFFTLPPPLSKIRKFSGNRADLLIVSDEPVSGKEKQLLQKITAALPVSQAAVLEIKEASSAARRRIFQEIQRDSRFFRKCLIFSEKPAPEDFLGNKTGEAPPSLKDRRFLQAPPLKQMTAAPPEEAQAKKRRLWADLQEWSAGFRP